MPAVLPRIDYCISTSKPVRITNRLSIQSKLMLMFLLVSMGSITLIAYLGYTTGRSSLNQTIVNNLTSIRAAKAHEIESYFQTIRSETRTLSENLMVIEAMAAFSEAFPALTSKRLSTEQASLLCQFYQEEFLPKLTANVEGDPSLGAYATLPTSASYLQYHYIASYGNPIGQKQRLNSADDGSAYSQVHRSYHPRFRKLVDELGYYDMFLIDAETGNIIPNKVKRVLRTAAMETDGVLCKPEPQVQTISYDDSAITYKVRLYLTSYDNVPKVRDDFMTRVWYAARRNQLEIPFPIRTVYHHEVTPASPNEMLDNLVDYLRSLPSLMTISHDTLEQLARHASFRHFGQGEVVIHQGELQVTPYFVLAGRAMMTFHTSGGAVQPVAEVGRGDFFGGNALFANQPSLTAVVAVDDLEVIAIATDTFRSVLDHTPRLARELGNVMASRRQIVQRLQQNPIGTIS